MNPGSLDPSGPLPSFKTNVNRAKTKRWVEAKSYSYDGDDWAGADEHDEYGGYDEEPQQKPTGLRQPGQQGPNAPQTTAERPPQQADQYGGPPHAPYQQPGRERGNSFGKGDDRRAVSGPPGHPGVSPIRTAYGPSPGMGNPNNQRNQGPYGQQSYPHLGQPRRPSFENQGRPGMPGPAYRGYPNPPRYSGEGSRTHSMNSNTSNDYHGRREFSNPAAVPQPLHPASRTPRKSSLGQSDAPQDLGSFNDMVQSPVSDNNSSQLPESQQTRDRSDSATTPRAFVRPADIYKRLQEERDKERQSQDSARPSMDAILGTNRRDDSPSKSGDDSETSRRRKPTLDTVTERKSEYGMEGLLASSKVQQSSNTQGLLPEISGFGEGFGDDFLGSMGSQNATARRAEGRQPESKVQGQQKTLTVPAGDSGKDSTNNDLQHQPSLGFRSVVHQAFDQQIPQTPSSASGSNVGRSNSESTSGISPIISREPSVAVPKQKESREEIPSIAEEPTLGTPRPLSLERPATPKDKIPDIPTKPARTPPPMFIPGHRRNISTPSPDNSPARTPGVAANKQLLEPQEAEIGMTTPTSTIHSTSSASNTRNEAVGQGIAPPPLEGSRILTSDNGLAGSRPTTPGSRAGSPTKGRVRDLAEKIESASNSRRGSDSSLRDKLSDFAAPQRPISDRNESFRPQLPGAWASYTTNVQTPPATVVEKSLIAKDFPTTVAPRVVETDDSETEDTVQREGTYIPRERDQTLTSRQEGTEGTNLRPTSLSPQLATPDDPVSSIVPTPMEMKSSDNVEPEYFAPIEPLKHRSRKSSASDLPRLAQTDDLDGMSTENSPNDLESDRLRKQLVRELSPQVEHFDDSAGGYLPAQSESRSSSPPAMKASIDNHESMLFPSEYESYWNDEDAMSGKNENIGAQSPVELASEDVKLSEAQNLPQQDLPEIQSALQADSSSMHPQLHPTSGYNIQEKQPDLSRRFSWEQASDIGSGQAEQPQITKEPQPRDLHNAFSPPEHLFDAQGTSEQPEVEYVNSNVGFDGPPEPQMRESPSGPSHSPLAEKPLPPVVPSDNQKIPAFREILALKTADERIGTYNSTREQFANMNTGLANWLVVTVDALPEHQGLLTNGGNFGTHRMAPLSKTPGASNPDQPYLSTPTSTGTSSPGQWKMGSSPSGGKLTSQQVQSKGKDLLHTAGIFGGKANKTAKGIFAKGRSRFRSSGGGDKALPKTPSPAASNVEFSTPKERRDPISTPSTIPIQGQHTAPKVTGIPRGPSVDKQLPALNTEETSTQPVSPLSTIHSQPNEPVDDIERSSPKPPARTGLAFQDRLTVHQSQMEPFEAATFPQDLVIPPQFAKPTAPTTAPTQITPTAPIADEFLKANSPYRSPSPLYNSPTPGSEHRTPTQADFNPTSYAHPGASLTPKLTSGSSFQPLPPGNPDVNTSNGLFPGQAQGQTERDEASSRRPSKRSTTFSFIGFQDTASEELALHTPTTPDDRSVHRAGAGNTPLRYGIDHDFVSSNQATPERTRRQSSYQPSQYSVAQSGSSREPVHYQEGAAPVHRRPHTSRDPSRDSFNPRHSTTEFEIKGVGPPSEDDMSAKKRSNRLSATWKSLTGSSKSDYEASSVQPSRERQDSAPESPTIEKRKKRRSFFGGGGSSTHAIDSSSKNENDLQYQQQHRSPPRASTEPPDRPRSSNKLQSQSIHKSQRSTISVTPTQEHGKKKRLSSLGSFFGRSNNKKSSVSVIGTPQSAFANTPPPQQYPPQFTSQNSFDRGQMYNHSPQAYQYPQNPMYTTPNLQQTSPYDNTPLEGYYSPESDESVTFSPGFMSGQRSTSATHPALRQPQAGTPYPATPHPPPPNEHPRQIHQHPVAHNQFQVAPVPPPNTQRTYKPPAYYDNNSSIPRSSPRNGTRSRSQSEAAVHSTSGPPPPPPKDKTYVPPLPLPKSETQGHRRQMPSGSSQATQEQKRQTRQSLPLLQTSSIAQSPEHSRATRSAILTPEDARKARQWEIESGGKVDSADRTKSPKKSRNEDREEKIVMSSTAYPGQEWHPGYGWDGE